MAPKRWQDDLLHFIMYFCGQGSPHEPEFSCQGDCMPLENRSTNISASEPMTAPSQLQYPQLLRELDARKPDSKLSAASTESDDDCLLKILPPGTTQNRDSRQLVENPASTKASACSSGTGSRSSMSPLLWAFA